LRQVQKESHLYHVSHLTRQKLKEMELRKQNGRKLEISKFPAHLIGSSSRRIIESHLMKILGTFVSKRYARHTYPEIENLYKRQHTQVKLHKCLRLHIQNINVYQIRSRFINQMKTYLLKRKTLNGI